MYYQGHTKDHPQNECYLWMRLMNNCIWGDISVTPGEKKNDQNLGKVI